APFLGGGDPPAGGDPPRRRAPPAAEQGARRHRRPLAAGRALTPAIGHRPSACMPALRADEAAGPPQPLQVVQAVSIGREPGLELSSGSRVVHTRTEFGSGLAHAHSLVRSDEYPYVRLSLLMAARPGTACAASGVT